MNPLVRNAMLLATCHYLYKNKLIVDDKKHSRLFVNQTDYISITPETAREMMEIEDVILLDVRTEREYEQGHIEGAILLPYDEIDLRAPVMLPNKDDIILIYCGRGFRAQVAAQKLINLGYTNVYEFGGINDWPYEIVQ